MSDLHNASPGLRDLTAAVRELHRRAGSPPSQKIMEALSSDDPWPGRFPLDFAASVLDGREVHPWAKMEVLIRRLVDWSPGVDAEEVIERIHAIWLTADIAVLLRRMQQGTDPITLETTLKAVDPTSPTIGRAYLQILRTPESRQPTAHETSISEWVLEGPQTQIGRDYESGVRLDGPAVSRRHALINRAGAIFTIVDLKSTNGTYLNRTRLEPGDEHYLDHEDQLGIGGFLLIFLTHQTMRS